MKATDTTTSWPLEMPPRMPPAWLLRKPSAVIIRSRCSVPGWATLVEAGADFHALGRVDAHHGAGQVGVELAVDRLTQAGGHVRAPRQLTRAPAESPDLRSASMKASSSGTTSAVRGKKRVVVHLSQSLSPVGAHEARAAPASPGSRYPAARPATCAPAPRPPRAWWFHAPRSARRRGSRGCRTSSSRYSRHGRGGTGAAILL